MWLEVLLVVCCVGWRTAALPPISHWDLQAGNWTCEGKESCKRERKLQPPNSMWLDRNCLCDKECSNYGDCCLDSPHFEFSEQRRAAASVSCVNLRQFGGIYMRTSCPSDWDEPSTRAACETASEDIRDPLAGFPATDNSTGVTYRNYFCAICHRAEEKSYIWQPRVECRLHANQSLTKEIVSQIIYFNEKERFWGLNLNNTFYPCSIDPVIPAQDQLIRRCIPNITKTCAVNWTNADIRDSCEAYTSLVYDTGSTYRNVHCAMCNNVRLEFLQCTGILFRGNFNSFFSNSAFSILLDFSHMPPMNKQSCKDEKQYDPFLKRCRGLKENIPQSLFQNTTSKIDFTSDPICKKILLGKNDFFLFNNTVYVKKNNEKYREGEFIIKNDGRVEICRSVGESTANPYMGFLTFAGLGVSIVFLLLHLTAFCLVSELRNLSGKNLASLCVALLIGYIAFLIGRFVEGSLCFVTAIITFYAFLAAFTWMLTMAFDVWRTLRLATSKLRVSAGKQWRKFIAYSLWSWLFPAMVVLMALWVEHKPGVDTDWRPGFNSNSCWFGHSRPLIIFFVVPLAVVMLVNITFFAFAAHMVYSTTSTTRFTSSASTQRDFRLYLRLAVLMGLTWTTGLVAGVLNFEFLWFLFVLLNTFQGLFIFLAFTCNNNVIHSLVVREGSKAEVIQTSWTTDSTRKYRIESEKTIDTLY